MRDQSSISALLARMEACFIRWLIVTLQRWVMWLETMNSILCYVVLEVPVRYQSRGI